MDENLVKTLFYSAVTFMLIAAISLFFVLYGNSDDMFTLVNKAITDKGIVYQTNKTDAVKTATGAEIIGSIKNGLNADIFIDSFFVPVTVDTDSFNYSLIDISSVYSMEYVFSQLGETILIKYIKQ